tara:strand:+ start:301 stop:1443 length:1143 start_codon:yes stop_codon:yes gene_type:complete
MSSDKSLLSIVWEVTRSHLEGTYVGEKSTMGGHPSFDFYADDYPHSSGNRKYDLEDFSSNVEEKKKSNFEQQSIFSWIEALLEKHNGVDLDSNEHKELELNLIRLTAMWGHTNGFRISKHLEYLESIEDDYVLNHIMGETLVEKYSEFGVSSENSKMLVSKLSAEELSLLIHDDFSITLKDAGVNNVLLSTDKYAWAQRIKDCLKDHRKNEISAKNLLIQGVEDTKQNQSNAGEMHQILITEGSLVHVSLAYVEIKVTIPGHPNEGVFEILGSYCGNSGDWRFFHVNDDGDVTVFDEPDFDTHITEIWDYIHQTEEARNTLLDIDEEGNIIGLSEEGEIFIEDCFESESDDGIRYSKTASAEYDYIYEIQGHWGLSFSMN